MTWFDHILKVVEWRIRQISLEKIVVPAPLSLHFSRALHLSLQQKLHLHFVLQPSAYQCFSLPSCILLPMPRWLSTDFSVHPRQVLSLLFIICLLTIIWLRAKCPEFQEILFLCFFSLLGRLNDAVGYPSWNISVLEVERDFCLSSYSHDSAVTEQQWVEWQR